MSARRPTTTPVGCIRGGSTKCAGSTASASTPSPARVTGATAPNPRPGATPRRPPPPRRRCRCRLGRATPAAGVHLQGRKPEDGSDVLRQGYATLKVPDHFCYRAILSCPCLRCVRGGYNSRAARTCLSFRIAPGGPDEIPDDFRLLDGGLCPYGRCRPRPPLNQDGLRDRPGKPQLDAAGQPVFRSHPADFPEPQRPVHQRPG